MRCLSPRTVGFGPDGKTIVWSQKNYSKEYPTFQLPCSKCIQCRLSYAREAAVRCYHEAQMHLENCFLTLTYSDEGFQTLGRKLSDKLYYVDFQKFIKRLRKTFPNKQISVFVTGEYGDKTKRPHWHACIFGWQPSDAKFKYSNDRGDRVYTSEVLSKLWPFGLSEFGSVTIDSAGYCARYAAKKLVHGRDEDHDYQPVHKRSSKNAIGKKWIEKYWKQTFDLGYVLVPSENGFQKISIPRYYEKWLKKHQPSEWARYVTTLKQKKLEKAEEKSLREAKNIYEINMLRLDQGKPMQISKSKVMKKIIMERFNRLQKARKGD